MYYHVRVQQLIAVLIEVELVVDEKRVREVRGVAARAEVLLESGQENFLCLAAPADYLLSLEDEHTETRLREVGSANEAVVTRARNDEVETLGPGTNLVVGRRLIVYRWRWASQGCQQNGYCSHRFQGCPAGCG
jgi:hypothetical protein